MSSEPLLGSLRYIGQMSLKLQYRNSVVQDELQEEVQGKVTGHLWRDNWTALSGPLSKGTFRPMFLVA